MAVLAAKGSLHPVFVRDRDVVARAVDLRLGALPIEPTR